MPPDLGLRLTAITLDCDDVGRVGTAPLQLCRERNAGAMHINVDEVDTDTRRFYERHGFLNVLPGTNYQMLFYEQEL